MKKLLIVTLFASVLFSCVQQKYIFKGNTVSTIKTYPTAPLATDSLFIYSVKEPFKGKIEEKGDFILIENVDKKNLDLVHATKLNKPPTGSKKDFVDKYYYPESNSQATIKKFRYFDSKPVLQGLSIPLKIRPKLEDIALLDSFPSQTETGFNPALAFGWKFNLNSISPKKDIFSNGKKVFSFTPGWFVGTGATDLKKSNTRNPVIAFDRKAAIISSGGFLMLGFNNVNVGYSFGWDHATGIGSNEWLYQGEIWHGLTIGIDIIK